MNWLLITAASLASFLTGMTFAKWMTSAKLENDALNALYARNRLIKTIYDHLRTQKSGTAKWVCKQILNDSKGDV